MSLQEKVLNGRKLLADYQNLKPLGGGDFKCEVCGRKYAGARYFFKIEGGEIAWFCPNCWPKVLKRLEQIMLAKEGPNG